MTAPDLKALIPPANPNVASAAKNWVVMPGLCWLVKGAPCLFCADLDHLVFLPSGDAALTCRSVKYFFLVVVVLKWSRVRKRYERQGILVE